MRPFDFFDEWMKEYRRLLKEVKRPKSDEDLRERAHRIVSKRFYAEPSPEKRPPPEPGKGK